MEDLAVITPLNHLGSFGKNFVKFKGKSKNVIHQPGLVCIRKNCALCLGLRFPNKDLLASE